jgi:hypothetical protein
MIPMNRLCVLVLLLALPGCSSPPPKKHAPPEPNPNYPVLFKIDRSNPPPMMEILATAAEILRLRGLYASFYLEMGNLEKGPMQSFQHDRKGSLELPWRFYLPPIKTPYVVRLMGVLPNGTREVIHEETY